MPISIDLITFIFSPNSVIQPPWLFSPGVTICNPFHWYFRFVFVKWVSCRAIIKLSQLEWSLYNRFISCLSFISFFRPRQFCVISIMFFGPGLVSISPPFINKREDRYFKNFHKYFQIRILVKTIIKVFFFKFWLRIKFIVVIDNSVIPLREIHVCFSSRASAIHLRENIDILEHHRKGCCEGHTKDRLSSLLMETTD